MTKPKGLPCLLIVAGAVIFCSMFALGAFNLLGLSGSGTGAFVGKEAPQFSLSDTNGRQLDLATFRGRVVIVNFWATWCPPCRQEMPLFQNVYLQNYKQLYVLAVNVEEPSGVVSNFLANRHITFPVLLDSDGDVSALYRVTALPTTYIIDQEGIIRFTHVGLMSESQLKKYLSDLGIY